ncbi:TPA: hypothetical protein RNS99_000691 [Stenotrophomonas maltophilia]|uniref:hypothetical protein n=1 Tax=Stenotrophomonas maltophilia TaxID=40324 RepID=UPI00066D1BCB|nr:hypothetical protein [Stenotrophomonas maltophilia]MDH2061339.1 hypothetical protein [Stenotrophomonas maltophilia]HDX0898511.1 hypothetical protein [Stenotrophomonas maltophilia]HDX0916471.1 hypothetical protein [Stenotrophomonas maltophilia]HEL3009967.1 hypothetical protein [Stenotrophomonas maltophilia]HEL4137551.1 hypothetical protein [Stenotrophomonas maltophilia]
MSAVTTPAVELMPCGNCGSDEVRMRARGSASIRRTAQVVCARCSAQSELCVGVEAEAQATKAWGHKTHAPPAPPAVRMVGGRVPVPEPTLQRDPLELIARMLVGGSFREPSDGRSAMQPLTAADISGAVGMMRDSVAKQAVMAVALRGQGVSLSSLGRSLARRVMRHIQWQRRSSVKPALRMDDPADRWRMRLVLQDAVNDLVWPERKVAARDAAKAAKMRKGDYLRVYGIAAAMLRQALEDGRKEFSGRVFNA